MLDQKTGPGPLIPGGQQDAIGEVCVPNISSSERRKRLVSGIIPFVLAVAALGWLISIDADRLWRLLLFLPFFMAGTGFFQWRDKT